MEEEEEEERGGRGVGGVSPAAAMPHTTCLRPAYHEFVGVSLASAKPTANMATTLRARVAPSLVHRQDSRESEAETLEQGRIHGTRGMKPPQAKARKETMAAVQGLAPRSSSSMPQWKRV